MISHQHYFLVYEKYDIGMVYLGDESPLNIVGCYGVLTRFPNGRVNGINGVLYILGPIRNIISIITLNDACTCKLFSLTKGAIWFEEIWYSLRVSMWALCSSLCTIQIVFYLYSG